MTRSLFCLLFAAALLSACQSSPYGSRFTEKTISVSTGNNVTSPFLTPVSNNTGMPHCERFEASMHEAENRLAERSIFDNAVGAPQEKYAMTPVDAL